MDNGSSRRRSGRAGRPNKKYTTDPFEQYRELLEQDSDNPSRAPSVHDTDEADGSDDEFDAAQAAAELTQAAAEDDDEEDSDGASDVSMEDEPAVVAEPEDEATISVSPDKAAKGKPKGKGARPSTGPGRPRNAGAMKRQPPHKKAQTFDYATLPIFDPMGATGAKGRNIHFSRGVPEAPHTQGRNERLLYTIGPGEEDLIAHIRARDRWLNDATVPSRERRKGKPGGGLAVSPFYPEEKREREAREEMGWYYEGGGREVFEKRQELRRKVDREFAPNNYARCDGMVAGPVSAMRLVDGVEFGESWNMGEAFAGTARAETQQGWVLNAGARVQALEWCHNQNGAAQYLAVATSCSPSDIELEEDNFAPAFTPQSRRQQCLQIWEVHAKSDKTGSPVDFSKPPQLRQVYSSDWGHIKKMRWCPVPDRQDASTKRLGFLGLVFSDGALRVLDIATPDEQAASPEFIHIDTAAVTSKPPETLFTCLTWLSSKSLALGTADGNVAVFSLPDCLKSTSQSQHPWLYQRMHQGYIQSLVSGYPSRPHLLITHSFDGFLRLTDLRSPSFDTAVSQRSRIAQGPVIWHDITQSALNVDDNFTMRSFGARIFYKATSVARFTAFAAGLGASCLHASVLVGCVDGTVWVTNPMRRLRDHKYRPLTHCVFKHEWRRPVQQSPSSTTNTATTTKTNTTTPDPVFAKPLIRLTQGFKIQLSDMGQENRVNATKDYVSFATVYEERTAITGVCWNPNLVAGTWAAWGTGSGLVVVKDLAMD